MIRAVIASNRTRRRDGGRADRARLSLRRDLHRPRRPAASAAAAVHSRGLRPGVRGDLRPVGGGPACRPGSSRRAAASPARESCSSTAGSRRGTAPCRTIRFLNAAGFHCLTFDVRGHGANPPETLPVSAGEFGADAAAALDALLRRPEVTRAGIFGHSMGGDGAILAAAADPRTAALVSTSAPSDPLSAHPADVPAGRLPFPDVDRLSPGLADDARLPPAATAPRRRRERPGRDRPLRGPDPARPRGGRPGRAGLAPAFGCPRLPRRARAATAASPRSRC